MIPFNQTPLVGGENQRIACAIEGGHLSGGGTFSRYCERWFESHIGSERALMTPSCTAALEFAAILVDIGEGDEVIMPSFTFVSTANAFALRGARIRFVDVNPRTLNIDPACVERALTARTRAIVPVHYAGVSCDMEALCDLAEQHGVWLIEDAAQAVGSSYRDEPVGSRGHLSAFSFHETKNLSAAGEGGVLCINEAELVERAEIIREKGTNRSAFFRGQVDKYSWVDIGSSFLLSEIQAAYLSTQLDRLHDIQAARMAIWQAYFDSMAPLANRYTLPDIPKECTHNAHIFHLRCDDLAHRTAILEDFRSAGVGAVFHYVPLHSSKAGRTFGEMVGADRYTTCESERLLRLPLWFGMPQSTIEEVAGTALEVLERHAAAPAAELT